MPQRTPRDGKGLFHLIFLSAALSLLSAGVRRDRSKLLMGSRKRTRKIQVGPRRIAATFALATIFFAGAALSAGAGNGVVQLLDSSGESALSADTTTTTTTTGEEEAVPPADPSAGDQSAPHTGAVDDSDTGAPPVEQQPPAESQPTMPGVSQAEVHAALSKQVHAGRAATGSSATGRGATAPQGGKAHGTSATNYGRQAPVVLAQPKVVRVDREPEADEPNVAPTIWLNRTLPDPTPPSLRLKPAFAHRLARVSARNHVDWALALAVLRSSGERGAVPASKARLLSLTKQLRSHHSQRDAWTSVLSIEGRTTFADRTIALQHLYRAVGLKALVKGFDWAKPSLSKRILNDRRITIYAGGRSDIQSGRVNIRVLVLIAYLAEAHGQVTVSCLISGHRLYARPGVVSAHIYGLAADISVLGNTPIFGHQQPGGVTEHAVRNILLLPAEMQPRQVISLLGLGGPSFPLANHYDHIHVGF
ncbi:MAG TPA: hypothetical protein VK488_00525 [Gaiellaceae bacterium]|nr:hypothetical protein [Gaiellaceae bacterium]